MLAFPAAPQPVAPYGIGYYRDLSGILSAVFVAHNETAYAIQKRLQWAGQTMVILPARVY